MKHLKQLEDAGLVVIRRRGREKLHLLNPIPIRLVHDRWIGKYTEPWAASLIGLKDELENPMEKVYEIYIRTTPERLCVVSSKPFTLLDHPRARALGSVAEIDDPTLGREIVTGPPLRLSRTPLRTHRPAPRLGEHSEQVLHELRSNKVTR